MEVVDIRNGEEHTYFKHLLYGSELTKLINKTAFDSSKLEIKLEINGIEVRSEDFNIVLKGWGKRIESQIREKCEYLSKEKAVIDNANILLQEKLGKAYEILNDIENSAWKLED